MMPEITLPWMLVTTVVLVNTASIPRKVLVDQLIVVVPVPFAAPNPIALPVRVNALPAEFNVIPA